jgi:hypothetical protein
MRGTGDIDGQRQTDPVIDLLSKLAEVAIVSAPPAGPDPTTDPIEAAPA